MKSLAIFILFCTLSFVGFSQSNWSHVLDESPYVKSYAKDLTILNDSILIVGGNADIHSCYFATLNAYNFDGVKLWDKKIGSDAVFTKNGVLYSLGYNIGIEDAGMDEHITFSRFKFNGDTLMYYEYAPEPFAIDFHGGYDIKPLDLEITPNKEFLFLSKDIFLKADSTGKVFWRKENSTELNYNDISVINENKYLASKKSSLILIDSSSVVLDSIIVSKEVRQSIVAGDTIYSLFSDASIVFLDTTLTPLDTLNFSMIFDSVFHILKKDSNLWVTGMKENTFVINSFNLTKKTNITYDIDIAIDYVSFDISGNNLFLLGNSKTSQISIRKIELPGFSTHIDVSSPDISIVDYISDSTSVRYAWQYEPPVPTGFDFYGKVVVKNEGDEILNSYSVYSDLYGGFNCLQNQLYKKAINITIFSGETDTLEISGYQNMISNNRICFECLAPNSQPEITISNNVFCKTIEVKTSIDRNTILTDVYVYPNPFEDEVMITSPFKIQNLVVTDVSGKVIVQKRNAGMDVRINLSNRKQGIYILFVTTNDVTITRKLVKEISY